MKLCGSLSILWTARRSNQSILKEINPEYSLEGLMLKLKLQYLATSWEELTHLKRSWCWEGLWIGGEGDNRGWNGWMASPTRWTWVWVNSGSCWWTRSPGVLWFMSLQRVDHDWATELNWRVVSSFWNSCFPPNYQTVLCTSTLMKPSSQVGLEMEWSLSSSRPQLFLSAVWNSSALQSSSSCCCVVDTNLSR